MLFSLDNKEVKHVPFLSNFEAWKRNLGDNNYQKICAILDERIDSDRIHTSSWIPGKDWTNTPYDPIYKAVGEDYENAAKFFGLILRQVIIDRPERWRFHKYEKDDDIKGTTYYIPDRELG